MIFLVLLLPFQVVVFGTLEVNSWFLLVVCCHVFLFWPDILPLYLAACKEYGDS